MSTAVATASWPLPGAAGRPVRPALRLVEGGAPVGPRPAVARQPSRRRASTEVRRRRLLVALGVVLSVGLALPLSGTGGRSHAAGPAPAGNLRPGTYTVRAGDTLWTIAERVDPTADPRPLAAELAAQIGSDTVVPGQRLVLP